MSGQVRTSTIAGSWYPGKPDALMSDIQAYLKKASVPKISAKPVVLISPHAGYVYSGKIAAHAYRAIAGQEYSSVRHIEPTFPISLSGAMVHMKLHWAR